VDEASYDALQGILSASATKLCPPLETGVAPDVDHGVACTWHWNFVKFTKLVGGCVGSTQ
jgi:hypothetical protein